MISTKLGGKVRVGMGNTTGIVAYGTMSWFVGSMRLKAF